jgi:hypothetical protein
MNDVLNIRQFVQNPGLIVDLVRNVIEALGVSLNDSDGSEREIQLLEVSKAIERLSSLGVSVPDALRVEKLRLACAAEIPEDVAKSLEPLFIELWELLGKIRGRLQKRGTACARTGYSLDQKESGYPPSSAESHDVQSFVTCPRDARRRTGLNQNAFWTRFGVTQSGGSRYESGREIAGPTQILMMLYASGKLNDDDLFEARMALGSAYKQSSE